jgi:hypothetical protein
LRDEDEVLKELGEEAGLSGDEARLYLKILSQGSVPARPMPKQAERLIETGMAILSGDGKRVIPVHPRLGVANHYRTWRESMVREINAKRMRTDKLILELIPLYEAAMEKRTSGGGG